MVVNEFFLTHPYLENKCSPSQFVTQCVKHSILKLYSLRSMGTTSVCTSVCSPSILGILGFGDVIYGDQIP